MMVTVEKKNCEIFTFSELEVGDFFEYDEKLCFKTDNDDKEINAFCFNKSFFTFFDDCEVVRKVENVTITY